MLLSQIPSEGLGHPGHLLRDRCLPKAALVEALSFISLSLAYSLEKPMDFVSKCPPPPSLALLLSRSSRATWWKVLRKDKGERWPGKGLSPKATGCVWGSIQTQPRGRGRSLLHGDPGQIYSATA